MKWNFAVWALGWTFFVHPPLVPAVRVLPKAFICFRFAYASFETLGEIFNEEQAVIIIKLDMTRNCNLNILVILINNFIIY